MPTDYRCSSCGLSISTGSYHGSGGEGWFNALYCRHCGSRYRLRESVDQFCDAFGAGEKCRKHWKYEISGPMTSLEVAVVEGQAPPRLRCATCGVEGPFGASGPITDKPPEGLPEDDLHPRSCDRNAVGTCPRCKARSMKVAGHWIT
jgi:hypothetical protein